MSGRRRTAASVRSLHLDSARLSSLEAPGDTEERDLFKESVLLLQMKDEENFQEAMTKAHLAYQTPSIPDDVKAVLGDEKAKTLTATSTKFWFLAASVAKFVATDGAGKLPLMGSIPDMHATTDLFVRLQHVY